MHQQEDPRCAVCKTRKEKAEEFIEMFEEFKGALSEEEVPELFKSKLAKIQNLIESLKLPEKPIPQRKVGACHFPDKECLVKESFEIFEEALEDEED